MRTLQVPLIALVLIGALLMGMDRQAQALPPAGSDLLPAVATIDTVSQLGAETIVLTGWARIDREAPRLEDGLEVVDLEIVSLSLRGASQIGAISVVERLNQDSAYVSAGEIRSQEMGQEFPASSFFDVFVDVTVPLTFPGGDSLVIHNETPLHLTPREDSAEVNLNAWPPLGVIYELEPIFGVDNDGDTLIDEDTADEDGDGLIDEDRPGPDPDTPGSGTECGSNPDCDSQEGEDPPLDYCIENALALCDDDGDGQMDEDPSCIPLMNAGNVNNMKAGFCVRNLTLEFAPELPSYSVARGGPSNLHPADILALLPGVVSEPPTPVSVSGNDAFADAWNIPALPFIGQQSTAAMTTEPDAGELTSIPRCPFFAVSISSTAWFRFLPSENASVTADTVGSTFDTVLAAYSGSSLETLSLLDCNDDFVAQQSQITFDVTAGTAYYFQVGSWASTSGGDLTLTVSESLTGQEGLPPFVRIACADLGLSADGCDDGADGNQDDLDALSFGGDLPADAGPGLNFSVGPGAQGVVGSAVEAQRNCPPAQPGTSPEPEPDVFHSLLGGTNELLLDGNGPVGACTSAFPLGLVEGATVRDDLDALYGQDPSAVDADRDGVPESPVYFSLDADSPSLAALGFSPADVLMTIDGGQPTVFAAEAELGLVAGDDLDALCLQESGDSIYVAGDDTLYFSLAPDSPTLAQIGAGPGDLLAPDSPNPIVAQGKAYLSLLAADDVDALNCQALSMDPYGDLDGDTIPNHIDADDDNDGCADEQELGVDPVAGGLRDPNNFWDFFDADRDGSVAFGDFLLLVRHFGSNDNNGEASINRNSDPLTTPDPGPGSYHPLVDRGEVLGPNPWNVGPPDGAIGFGDFLALVGQFGHSCADA